MFTGIVEEVGRLASVEPRSDGRRLRIAADRILDGIRTGDSVAVLGVCLTVAGIGKGLLDFDAIATTLDRTTLIALTAGDEVNLERALRFGDRLGGHLMQGHVDATGEVLDLRRTPGETIVELGLPDIVGEVTVPRGAIAVDGVSLTVRDTPAAGVARVALIPYTLEHTTLRHLRPGRRVNLEGDMLGRFVRHWLDGRGEARGDRG